jgi:hypothetical protein
VPEFTVIAASKKKDLPDAKFGAAQVIALTLKEGDGEAKQAEWFTKATTQIPAEGSKLEGDLTHDEQYGWKFRKPKGNGNFGGGGGGGSYNDPERDARIARSVAFKGAVDLVAASLSPATEVQVEEMAGIIGSLTDRLLPVVTDVGVGSPRPAEQAKVSGGAPEPGADSSANGDRASEGQRSYLFGGGGKGPGLLERAKFSDTERRAILLLAGEPLSKAAATRLIELLKDDPEKAGRTLVADLERKAQAGDTKVAEALMQGGSDVPADLADMQPVPAPADPADDDPLFPAPL